MGVYSAGWLIKDHDRRTTQEGNDDGQLTFHPSREARHLHVGCVLETNINQETTRKTLTSDLMHRI